MDELTASSPRALFQAGASLIAAGECLTMSHVDYLEVLSHGAASGFKHEGMSHDWFEQRDQTFFRELDLDSLPLRHHYSAPAMLVELRERGHIQMWDMDGHTEERWFHWPDLMAADAADDRDEVQRLSTVSDDDILYSRTIERMEAATSLRRGLIEAGRLNHIAPTDVKPPWVGPNRERFLDEVAGELVDSFKRLHSPVMEEGASLVLSYRPFVDWFGAEYGTPISEESHVHLPRLTKAVSRHSTNFCVSDALDLMESAEPVERLLKLLERQRDLRATGIDGLSLLLSIPGLGGSAIGAAPSISSLVMRGLRRLRGR